MDTQSNKHFMSLVRYESYKGGVNNLQCVDVVESGSLRHIKTFTSTSGKAEKYANSWIKKNTPKQIFYFAGGIYFRNNGKNTEFDAVRPTGGLPYITDSDRGLQLTSHHSSLYLISPDFTEAWLIDKRSGGVDESPYTVKLSDKLQAEIKESISVNGLYS